MLNEEDPDGFSMLNEKGRERFLEEMGENLRQKMDDPLGDAMVQTFADRLANLSIENFGTADRPIDLRTYRFGEELEGEAMRRLAGQAQARGLLEKAR